MMDRNVSRRLLLSLCRHLTSVDNREIIIKADVSLLVDMCNFLLLHDNKIVLTSEPQFQGSNMPSKFIQQQLRAQQFWQRNNTDKTSGTRVGSVLHDELVQCLGAARLDGLTNECTARLFIALLNLQLCITHGRCYVMQKSVAESREFANSFEALTMSHLFGLPTVIGELGGNHCQEFPLVCTSLYNRASGKVSENILEILLQMWNSDMSRELWALLTAEDKPSSVCGGVSGHERYFLASILLEGCSQLKQPEGRTSLECGNALQMLSAKLEAMLAPFAEILLRWMEKKKDLENACGSPEGQARAMFIIDERLKGYVGMLDGFYYF